ncbi:mechanosensitive ion channel domain-containing protein [Mastigocoleus sp. MO_188.B34]|uniref:mechanosensitive ion channel family protein n=1 Tax=Mastigocoleus sp. MO_188.B34 TaxID=3036635 RepID=UPI0026226171|nr:mechanosensitive ion channel domain-containing protein [Mastigocoleus sp. MO_188.B34]MDJ0692919.1 mechanosensitive ion channel [Mastigocoleus sp. MO_188.B34]
MFLAFTDAQLALSFAISNLPSNSIFKIATVICLVGIVTIAVSIFLPKISELAIERLTSLQFQEIYHQVLMPYQNQIILVVLLTVIDVIILISPLEEWLKLFELIFGLVIAIIVIWLALRIFKQFFDVYLLNAALRTQRRLDSEILILAKFLVNATIILIVVFIFAQTHQINLVGLLASLGIGGLAVAFAAQKTLEQLLGGVVLHLDRPFAIDDYVQLPDRTFGRVESIGWRSTKIRTSGKGSLVIIPNNILTQVSIENLTNAKKVISLIYLTLYKAISQEERALIRQVILDSTKDIFGLDNRITKVNFKDIVDELDQNIVEAQVTLFLLGSGEISMELRKQLLDIAKQNISYKLKEYGIIFDIKEKTINVSSPINL